MNDDSARAVSRQQFLTACGHPRPRLEPLLGDASTRRYFRLCATDPPVLLMDMGEMGTGPYLRVAAHLRKLALRVPRVYVTDTEHGLVLLEDLGEATFTRLLAQGADEAALYRLAVDQLIRLHDHAEATAVAVPCYGEDVMLEEAGRLVSWLLPLWRGRQATTEEQASYRLVWQRILRALPPAPRSLVLVDFHVDNLMRLDDGQCALLDFQDARIGPTAYDVVSLLEDARRDVTPAVVRQIREHYLGPRPAAERAAFEQWYTVLGAQRHCKILGLFVRLCLRDDKCSYLAHIPRVQRLLANHLRYPLLAPLEDWFDRYLPEWSSPVPAFDARLLRERLAIR